LASSVKTSSSALSSTRRFHSNDQSHSNSKSYFSGKNKYFAISSVAAAGALAFGAWTFDQQDASADEKKEVALNPKEFIDFKLREIIDVNHNTKIFRFNLQTPETEVGLPVASCIVIKVPKGGPDGKDVIRPYTPISSNETKGYVDLMIKLYPNGIASNYIFNMKKGDTLAMKGPIPKIAIKSNMKKEIGMVSGGTGLTPMIQVAREILKSPDNKTKISFIFANIAEEDILSRRELEELQAQHKNNFKVHYVLEKPPKGWKGDVGYVTQDMVKKYLPPPSDDNLIMVCGPPPMVEKISGNKAPDYSQGELKGYLKELGFKSEQVFKF